MTVVRLAVGDVVRVTLPWSEVCMHMNVAGQSRPVQVREHGAQILDEELVQFSFPVTHGEAGLYRDSEGLYVHDGVKALPCGCVPHQTRMSGMGTALVCVTEGHPYCNFECPHGDDE